MFTCAFAVHNSMHTHFFLLKFHFSFRCSALRICWIFVDFSDQFNKRCNAVKCYKKRTQQKKWKWIDEMMVCIVLFSRRFGLLFSSCWFVVAFGCSIRFFVHSTLNRIASGQVRRWEKLHDVVARVQCFGILASSSSPL